MKFPKLQHRELIPMLKHAQDWHLERKTVRMGKKKKEHTTESKWKLHSSLQTKCTYLVPQGQRMVVTITGTTEYIINGTAWKWCTPPFSFSSAAFDIAGTRDENKENSKGVLSTLLPNYPMHYLKGKFFYWRKQLEAR
jgi:hypothetical protein